MRGLVGSFTLFMSMCQSCVMRRRESDVLKRKGEGQPDIYSENWRTNRPFIVRYCP